VKKENVFLKEERKGFDLKCHESKVLFFYK
jgi:hypothetical protein